MLILRSYALLKKEVNHCNVISYLLAVAHHYTSVLLHY